MALLTALAAAASSAPVEAQTMPWINPTIISTTTGTDVMSVVLDNDRAGNGHGGRAGAGLTTSLFGPGEPPSAGENAYTFRYDRDRTGTNLQKFLARTSDPAARADLQRMLAAQPALMDEIGEGVRGYGFDPHNVADAYAVWWINVWGASQKRNIEPDAPTVAAVKRQVRNAFAASPAYAKASDAERQEYAEALLLQASIIGSAFEQWKNDPRLLEQLAEAAAKGAKASGVDLSKMTLTQAGFVPRKSADASASESERSPVRNARLDAAPAGSGEEPWLGAGITAVSVIGVALLGGGSVLRKG